MKYLKMKFIIAETIYKYNNSLEKNDNNRDRVILSCAYFCTG